MNTKYLIPIPLILSVSAYAEQNERQLWSGELDFGLTKFNR